MTQFQLETITVKTRACFHCHQPSEVKVLKSDYDRWHSGALIQEAFPEMPLNQRELLQTGIHPECWAKMFPKKEEDDS